MIYKFNNCRVGHGTSFIWRRAIDPANRLLYYITVKNVRVDGADDVGIMAAGAGLLTAPVSKRDYRGSACPMIEVAFTTFHIGEAFYSAGYLSMLDIYCNNGEVRLPEVHQPILK